MNRKTQANWDGRSAFGPDPLADHSIFDESKQINSNADVAEPFVRNPDAFIEDAAVDSFESTGRSLVDLLQQNNLGGSIVAADPHESLTHDKTTNIDAPISAVEESVWAKGVGIDSTLLEPESFSEVLKDVECDSPMVAELQISAHESVVEAPTEPLDLPLIVKPDAKFDMPVLAQKPHEALVRSSSASDDGFQIIDQIDDLPYFKGVVARVVSEKNQRDVAVLDVGCASVIILCTATFLKSPLHLTLVSTLGSNRFQFFVQAEYVTTKGLIAEVRALAERRSQQRLIPVINADNKHIVLYDEIVEKAVALKATDIHFELSDSETSRIRLRIYGRLHDWRSFPTELLMGALTAAYSKRTKSGTNSAGALSLERAMNTVTEQVVNGKAFNGRFNGYPLVNGYDVVMRLLETDPRSVVPTVQELGYAESHVEEQIIPAIKKNAGMIAIAGSTGSGKSTALRSFIYSIPDRDRLKIFGVEDPTEYINPFMRQISVQRNSDDEEHVVKMKFLSALRSVLRMDPDVLMLGEIRDRDSASLASEFNRTGHRVFSTVHGDGCVDVLARLASDEIGIHPSTLAAKKYLSAVMYQKLMPVLCEHCKVPAVNVLTERQQGILRSKFLLDPAKMFCSSEVGCAHCKLEGVNGGGTKGLTVVAEILTPTEEMLELIRDCDWLGVESIWRSQRSAHYDSPNMAGKTAYEHALYKASIGLIDPRDIETDFESFGSYRLFERGSAHVGLDA